MSLGKYFLAVKYIGMPTNPAIVKPINCLFVRLRATLVFILLRSFGTGIYAI